MKPVYCIFGNNLFGEYEFITHQKCNYTVKTHPKMTAFGFELKQEVWENISKKYIISAKNFLDTIKKRKKKHNYWIDWSMNELNENIFKDDIIFEPNLIQTKKSEGKGEQKNELLMNLIDTKTNNKNDVSDTILSRYVSGNIKLDKTLITLAEEKNEKYDINNKEIFFNITEMRKKLKSIEDQFIDFKKSLINHFKIKAS